MLRTYLFRNVKEALGNILLSTKIVKSCVFTKNNTNNYTYVYCLILGDLQNEESVLEWLIDDENRELADEIEEVNARMLERLLDESLLLAVFFCKCTSK